MRKVQIKGRSRLAREAQFRTGAGAMGGTRKQQIRRRRQADRAEEKRTVREELGR